MKLGTFSLLLRFSLILSLANKLLFYYIYHLPPFWPVLHIAARVIFIKPWPDYYYSTHQSIPRLHNDNRKNYCIRVPSCSHSLNFHSHLQLRKPLLQPVANSAMCEPYVLAVLDYVIPHIQNMLSHCLPTDGPPAPHVFSFFSTWWNPTHPSRNYSTLLWSFS